MRKDTLIILLVIQFVIKIINVTLLIIWYTEETLVLLCNDTRLTGRSSIRAKNILCPSIEIVRRDLGASSRIEKR
jgi:hypothetical protein